MATTTELAPEPESTTAFDLSMPTRVLLAALSAGAGAVHLVMAPIHASSSSLEAFAFAGAGWFQIIFAGVILARPSRPWLQAAIVANLAFIAVWAVSRTAGLPIGAHPGTAEAIDTIDLVTVSLQVLLVAMTGVALVHPRVLGDLPAAALAIGAGVPVAILVAATLVVVSPSTVTHAHDETEASSVAPGATGDLASTSARCDAALNPVAYWEEAKLAGTDGVTPVAADAPAATGGHAHGGAAPAVTATPTTPTTLGPLKGRGSVQYDKLLQLAGQPGEAAAGFLIAELANATDDEYHEFIASLNPANAAGGHAMEEAGTGNNSEATSHTMSHLGPQEWKPMSDQADCQQVVDELAQTKAVAMSFPTATEAKAAGYVRVAPYVPGIASHWMKFSVVDGTFDINEPEMLLYDGNGDNSHIVGVSYYVVMAGETQPSQGFTGDNDHYHRHIGLCNSATGGVIGDSTTTDAECEALGGRKSTGGAGWMSHAWVVPGCESPWGVFSGINPLLDKATGDASGTNEGGCAASAVRDRYELGAGTTETLPTTTVPAETEQAAGN